MIKTKKTYLHRISSIKKSILTALALGLFSMVAHAQYFGLKGGLNFSKMQIDKAEETSMRSGYHFGAYVNLPITENFGVQPEVLYSTKGTKGKYEIAEVINGDFNLKLNYIDIPLLGVFKLGKMAEIQVGPYFGFLANSAYDVDGDLNDENEIDSDDLKPLDYGLVGGFAINLSALQIGARYNYGLQKVEDSDVADYLIGDAKNSYFQIFAALRFGDY